MVRFARSGGEANAIAIRIARAAAGKIMLQYVILWWHDWYLSTNLNDTSEDNLSSHLIAGLEPKGVPNNLKNTVYSFKYNNYEELEYLVNSKNIGVVKMEVIRNYEPKMIFSKS